MKEVTGKQFYEDFKDALSAVGLRFGEMHLARVTVADNTVTVRYRSKSVTLHFGEDHEPA
jgi:hypothetical protein